MNHLNNGHVGNGRVETHGAPNRLAGGRPTAEPKAGAGPAVPEAPTGQREAVAAASKAQPEAPVKQPQRDAFGRFLRGNPGGPGNPFTRQVALIRRVLLDCVTAEDIAAVARQLIALAKAGNVAAAKVVLAYTIGKPTPAPDPDQLNLQEFALLRDEGRINEAVLPEIEKPHPDLFLTLLNVKRDAVTKRYGGLALELNEAWMTPKQSRRLYPEGIEKELEKQGIPPSLDGLTRKQRRKMARAARRAIRRPK